jgi:LysR family transcriptional regulator, glycine cleavage system transcriptional activator
MARLPPLNSLRSFEAAGRHVSFTRAAQELNVTQAAVSHQIKALEETLGVQLFRRQNRTLALTEAGRAYLAPISAAFQAMAEATERLRRRDAEGTLTVSVLPSFGSKWLVPRLGRFRELHPAIDVRVSASYHLVDFAREDVDVAIRFGQGDWPGLHVERLMTEDQFPVCSPGLLERGPPLGSPDDLKGHVLLHDMWFGDPHEGWRRWLAAVGVEGLDWRRGPVFSDSGMAVQAAIDGQGVALGREALVRDDLAAGRLLRPLATAVPTSVAYWLVCPRGALARPKVKAFHAWIVGQTAGGAEGG